MGGGGGSGVCVWGEGSLTITIYSHGGALAGPLSGRTGPLAAWPGRDLLTQRASGIPPAAQPPRRPWLQHPGGPWWNLGHVTKREMTHL